MNPIYTLINIIFGVKLQYRKQLIHVTILVTITRKNVSWNIGQWFIFRLYFFVAVSQYSEFCFYFQTQMYIFKRRLSTFLQLNESSKAIQNVCRIFAENELKPVASQHDKLAKYVRIFYVIECR